MESANDYLWEEMFWLSNAGQGFIVILTATLLFIIALNGKLNIIYHVWKKLELKTLNDFRIYFLLFKIQVMKSLRWD